MRFLFPLFLAWVMSASAAEPLVVETVSPRTAQADADLVLLGQLEPVQNSQLGFELAGRVTSILVDEGDAVAAGQVLATLDTDLLRAQRRELIAAIDQAEASLTLADVSLKRLNEARSQGAITDQNLDEAQQAKQDAEGRLAVLNAQLSGLDIQMDKHQLLAPYDGFVIAKRLSAGTVVAPGTAVLGLNSQSLRLRVGLPDSDGQPTALKLASGERLPIQRSVPQRDAVTGLQNVLVDWPLERSGLAGDWIRVQAVGMPSKRDWELPLSAVTRLAGIWGGYRVINDRAVFTELNILATDGQTTRVNGRINELDRFIANGLHRVVPDLPVRALP